MGKKGEGNRQCIIAAAEDLFYQRGYNQTSFQDISDATNIPRGNFYYYFKTKEDILNAVIDARVSALSILLNKFDTEITSPRERLLMFTNRLEHDADDIAQSGCPTGTLCAELAKGDAPLHEKSKQVFVVLRVWMKQQFEMMGVSNADELSMDLITRLQGINLMASVFKDEAYLTRSHTDIHDWINEQG